MSFSRKCTQIENRFLIICKKKSNFVTYCGDQRVKGINLCLKFIQMRFGNSGGILKYDLNPIKCIVQSKII